MFTWSVVNCLFFSSYRADTKVLKYYFMTTLTLYSSSQIDIQINSEFFAKQTIALFLLLMYWSAIYRFTTEGRIYWCTQLKGLTIHVREGERDKEFILQWEDSYYTNLSKANWICHVQTECGGLNNLSCTALHWPKCLTHNNLVI